MNDGTILSNETRLTQLQALVVEILNDLLRAPIEQTDASINAAIARIGAFCRRDRAYVFVNAGEVTDNTHEWCAEGIEPAIDQLQGLPIELYGPITDHLNMGNPFHVPDVSALEPRSPSRLILESQAIRSSLMVPMRWEGATYGMVGFDGVTNTHAFLDGEVYLLQSVADVICSVLVRREKDLIARQFQQELADERAFLASVLGTPAMGVIVIDVSGEIVYANGAAETVMRVSREQMLGRSHEPRYWSYTKEDGGQLEQGETPFERVLATGAPIQGERFALQFEDGVRYCSVDAAPVLNEQHETVRVVYALTDITKQVHAERERSLALEEAHRANAAKSNFLAKMSHEMRTPLNGVLGVAEVLDRMITDSDQRRMVKVMHDSGALLLSIINDLLDMSKIEADLMTLEAVAFVPADLAVRLEAVHTLKASEKQVSFSVQVAGDGSRARIGDPNRLLQVMHNIVSNAVKFTEKGRITVLIDCRDPHMVTLDVADTGIGMSSDQMDRVFEEFGQADSTIARRFGGTGLGMPIVRKLVQMMGGTITIESEPGVGTRILAELPLPESDAGLRVATIDTVSARSLGLVGLRVLAADDNRTNRMILGAMLAQVGIAANLVADGAEALAAFDPGTLDLVILDISMPDIDGVSVMKQMRARLEQEGRARHMPILAFTANAMTHQVDSYLSAGFDACLTKPLQTDRLVDELQKVIDRHGRNGQVVPLRKGAQTGV